MRSLACTAVISANGAYSLRVKQFTTSTACPRSSHDAIASEREKAASSRCGESTTIFTINLLIYLITLGPGSEASARAEPSSGAASEASAGAASPQHLAPVVACLLLLGEHGI